jgi:hypothetical protein
MVRIEDVSYETPEETRRAHFKPFPFKYASLMWYIFLPLGMFLNAFVAFYPIRSIKSPTFAVTFLSFFYNIQSAIAWIFYIAVLLHVLETIFVYFKYPKETSSNTRLQWSVQTFLLGFPSTSLFMHQLARMSNKKT